MKKDVERIEPEISWRETAVYEDGWQDLYLGLEGRGQEKKKKKKNRVTTAVIAGLAIRREIDAFRKLISTTPTSAPRYVARS